MATLGSGSGKSVELTGGFPRGSPSALPTALSLLSQQLRLQVVSVRHSQAFPLPASRWQCSAENGGRLRYRRPSSPPVPFWEWPG